LYLCDTDILDNKTSALDALSVGNILRL